MTVVSGKTMARIPPGSPVGDMFVPVLVEPMPGVRGPGQNLLALTEELGRRREVIAIAPRGALVERLRRETTAAVIELPSRDGRVRSWARGAARIRAELGPSARVVFHANTISGLNLVAPAAIRTGAGVLVHHHHYEMDRASARHVRMWTRAGVRVRLASVSEFGRGLLHGGGLDAFTSGVIPNVIRWSDFDRSRTPSDTFRIAWIGGKEPRKGLHHAAGIMRLLAEPLAAGAIQFHVAGVEPTWRRDPYVRTCLEAIDRLGSGAVRWHGVVRDLPAFYAQVDAVLVTSELESFGRVPMEAAAAGLPVVASRVPGISEVMRDLETGFLFDLARPAEAASLLTVLWRDPGARAQMGERARIVARRFDVVGVADRLESLYAELAPASNRRRGRGSGVSM